MSIDIINERLMQDEIVHWVWDTLGYYAFTSSGMSINIVRSTSVQPSIQRPDDYYTYLWLETLQGFFLARQRIVDSAPQGWWIVRQLIPNVGHHFFQAFQDDIASYVERLEARAASDETYGGDSELLSSAG